MIKNQLLAGSLGFTFIELMIVIAVIASILLYVIPVAYGAVKKTHITNIALNMRNVAKAVENYFYTEGSKMSKASEADLKWLDLNFLTDRNYLPSVPEGIEIDWKDSNVSDGTATVMVKFMDDIDVEELRKIWDEVVDKDGTPVICRRLAKYW